jgi:DNA-directed RNA polymerase subunit L
MTEKGPVYELSPKKLVLHKCVSKMDGFDLIINGEDHTFGNMVSKHLQTFFQGDNCAIKNLLSFVSYNKPHPLKDQIIVRIKMGDNVDSNGMVKFISEHTDLLDPRLRDALSRLGDLGEDELIKFCTIFIFIQGINGILEVLHKIDNTWDQLISKWTSDHSVVPNPNFLTFSKTSMDGETWYPNLDSKSDAMYLKIKEFH